MDVHWSFYRHFCALVLSYPLTEVPPGFEHPVFRIFHLFAVALKV